MAIIILDGSNQEVIGNMLRDSQISSGKGALLVKATQEGDPKHQLEKIISGMALPDEPLDADQVPWKSSPVVIIAAAKESVLAEFEALVPGFTAKFGPVSRIDTGIIVT